MLQAMHNFVSACGWCVELQHPFVMFVCKMDGPCLHLLHQVGLSFVGAPVTIHALQMQITA